jgi:peptidoglycan/xylan/chitin deacetylase (PgdA/CDA1 family)
MTGGRLIVTTSWDDGFPADLRVAELLAKYGVAGTFYVPNRNAEGRPVLSEQEVRTLSRGFEVGGHSIDHVVLTDLTNAEAQRQIVENKAWLENVTGASVRGFCYVRGRYSTELAAGVRTAGFAYARTVANLYAVNDGDPFEMPTTIQLFPHRKSVYLKGFARGRLTAARARLLWTALAADTIERRIERLIDQCARLGGYFHMWGHSWEIDDLDLWGLLETVLRQLAARRESITFVTNFEAHRMASRSPGS